MKHPTFLACQTSGSNCADSDRWFSVTLAHTLPVRGTGRWSVPLHETVARCSPQTPGRYLDVFSFRILPFGFSLSSETRGEFPGDRRPQSDSLPPLLGSQRRRPAAEVPGRGVPPRLSPGPRPAGGRAGRHTHPEAAVDGGATCTAQASGPPPRAAAACAALCGGQGGRPPSCKPRVPLWGSPAPDKRCELGGPRMHVHWRLSRRRPLPSPCHPAPGQSPAAAEL